MSIIVKKMSKLVLLTLILSLVLPATIFAQISPAERVEGAVVLNLGSSFAFVQNEKVLIDENDQTVKPIVKDGRTLVPVRFVSESLGAEVNWIVETSTVTVALEGKKIEFVLGNKKLKIDNVEMELDVDAEVTNGRT